MTQNNQQELRDELKEYLDDTISEVFSEFIVYSAIGSDDHNELRKELCKRIAETIDFALSRPLPRPLDEGEVEEEYKAALTRLEHMPEYSFAAQRISQTLTALHSRIATLEGERKDLLIDVEALHNFFAHYNIHEGISYSWAETLQSHVKILYEIIKEQPK